MTPAFEKWLREHVTDAGRRAALAKAADGLVDMYNAERIDLEDVLTISECPPLHVRGFSGPGKRSETLAVLLHSRRTRGRRSLRYVRRPVPPTVLPPELLQKEATVPPPELPQKKATNFPLPPLGYSPLGHPPA